MAYFPKVFLLAVIAVPMLGSHAYAQRPFERLQRDLDNLRPRGRILREIFGDNDPKPQPTKAQLEEQRRRAAANRNGGRQPTPAANSGRGQQTRSSGNLATNRRSPAQPGAGAGVGAASNQSRHPSRLEILVRESSKPAGLIVDRINQTGAAWAAGIRQNDLITKVGGIPTTTKDAISDIVKIMKDGDQIEFEFLRQGKADKALVQLGDPPALDGENEDVAPGQAAGKIGDIGDSRGARNLLSDYNRRPANPVAGSPQNSGQRSSRRDLNSVLDQSMMRSGQQPSPASTQPGSQSNGRFATGAARSNWQVQPPRSNMPRTQPTPPVYQPATPDVNELRRKLEQQQREIERLQSQLRKTIPATGQRPPSEPEPDLDSLLDFDFDK